MNDGRFELFKSLRVKKYPTVRSDTRCESLRRRRMGRGQQVVGVGGGGRVGGGGQWDDGRGWGGRVRGGVLWDDGRGWGGGVGGLLRFVRSYSSRVGGGYVGATDR